MHALKRAAVVWTSGLSVSSVAGQEADDIILQVKQLRTQLGNDKIDKVVEEYPRQVPSMYFLLPMILCVARGSICTQRKEKTTPFGVNLMRSPV